MQGFHYIENYLTKEELKEIDAFLRKANEWKHVTPNKTSRRVLHYGYNYSYNGSGLKKISDIPNIFKKLVTVDRVNSSINKNLLTEDMEQLIINEYIPKQGISYHTDHEKLFGPIIVCLTVGSGVEIEFINKETDEKIVQYLDVGSLYIMSGESRYKWKHGIIGKLYDGDKKRSTRYSITYRTVTEYGKGKSHKSKYNEYKKITAKDIEEFEELIKD